MNMDKYGNGYYLKRKAGDTDVLLLKRQEVDIKKRSKTQELYDHKEGYYYEK